MAIWDFDLKINTVDLTTYGFGLSAMPGNWDSPSQSYPEVAIPTREGTTRTALTPVVDSLDVTFNGEVNAATETAFEDNVRKLKYALRAPSLVVVAGNQETLQRTGALKGAVK